MTLSNENDKSIALLITYGGFDYLWASDRGGGQSDKACTGCSTSQKDVETRVIDAIIANGMITEGGIDVLNVNHHGSESSTNTNWFNKSAPALAVIPTGAGPKQDSWQLPRWDVVNNVLRAYSECVTVPQAFVLQSKEGDRSGPQTSRTGYSFGNITITTTGQNTFTVDADGQVSHGPNERNAAGLARTFPLDD